MDDTQFKLEIKKLFDNKNPPFLFLGSGFSRRYLNLPDFRELLSSLCVSGMKDFTYYRGSSNDSMPVAASKMANDFFEAIYSDKTHEDFLNCHKEKFDNKDSAFKYKISEFISELMDKNFDPANDQELLKLQNSKIDAIITTNYDTLTESLFPNYKTYVGQDDLISNNPQRVGEIYKIHGCINDPESIIITEEDYKNFSKRNTYLAAKLVTSFVERPIIFIGYSITDNHIKSIVSDVSQCLSYDIDRIKDNLIFVSRSKGKGNSISTGHINDSDHLIPYTMLKTDNYGLVYESVTSQRRQIPANLLRILKEQLYEIALTNDPSDRINVISQLDLESDSTVDFVVGIGISKKIPQIGYTAPSKVNLFNNILTGTPEFDSKQLLLATIPTLLKRTKFIPIFKFLNDIKIYNTQQLIESEIACDTLDKALKLTESDYRSTLPYTISAISKLNLRSFDEIYEKHTPDKIKIATWLASLTPEEINRDSDPICNFLKDQIKHSVDTGEAPKSEISKLLCYVDRCLYGWF